MICTYVENASVAEVDAAEEEERQGEGSGEADVAAEGGPQRLEPRADLPRFEGEGEGEARRTGGEVEEGRGGRFFDLLGLPKWELSARWVPLDSLDQLPRSPCVVFPCWVNI